MTNKGKGKAIKATAVCVDVIPAAVATLVQFPIWTQRSPQATVSGLFVLMAAMSCMPFWKQLKTYFKSPSSWVMWLIVLVVLIALRHIIDEMVPVCFIGLISNVIGEFVWKYGKHVEEKPDKPKTEPEAEPETEHS